MKAKRKLLSFGIILIFMFTFLYIVIPKTKAATPQYLKVHYIDVGQADSILIQQGPNTMLIDAGNNEDEETIIKYLKKQGIKKLDVIIGTHPHEDHIGSMDAVIESFDIGKVYMPKVTSNTKTFSDVLEAVKRKGLKISLPTLGTTFKIGNASCTILAPNGTKYDDLNNYSIVVKVTYGKNSFLFSGDAEAISEMEMVNKKYNLKADVLKLGHHGSSSSTCANFLNVVNPKYAVVSVGKGNKYGHPTKGTMDRIKAKKITVYRTDESGTIIATSDGKNIKFDKKPGSYKYASDSTSGSNTSSTKPSTTGSMGKIVYFTPNGKSYHFTKSCSTLSRSKTILQGTLKEAINSGHADPCNRCVH